MDDAAEILLSRLIRNARVAALGTIRAEGPNVSMVAFVAKEDFSAFFIHVSRLAQHTVDMRKDKHVSLLIAETDDGRTDPQTLARVSIRGSAEPMVVGEPGYNPIKKSYIDQFPTSAPLFELTISACGGFGREAEDSSQVSQRHTTSPPKPCKTHPAGEWEG